MANCPPTAQHWPAGGAKHLPPLPAATSAAQLLSQLPLLLLGSLEEAVDLRALLLSFFKFTQ